MQEIYNFMGERDPSETFKDISHNSDYSMADIKTVWNEKKSMRSYIDQLMGGTAIIVPAEYDTGGELISDDVYFTPSTEQTLLDQLSSDILDEVIVLTDYIIFKVGYDSYTVFAEMY